MSPLFGKYRLVGLIGVAWTPSGTPVARQVEVATSGGEATFTLEVSERTTHSNKVRAAVWVLRGLIPHLDLQ